MNNVPRSLKEFSETWMQGKGPLPIRLIMFFTWAMWARGTRWLSKKDYLKLLLT
jgi:hypothetical protein